MKNIAAIIFGFLLFTLPACEPSPETEEGKEAVKKDTIDPREGQREGDVGEGEIGGYEHNQ
ncbi:MAG: hypothetical protein ACNS60_08885 [Candidatus Cyclobacteriaceae bacterium M2_1C_046]